MKTFISANTLLLIFVLVAMTAMLPSSVHAKKDSYRLFRRLPKASKKQGTYPPSSSRYTSPPSKSDKHFSMGKAVKTKALKTTYHECSSKSIKAMSYPYSMSHSYSFSHSMPMSHSMSMPSSKNAKVSKCSNKKAVEPEVNFVRVTLDYVNECVGTDINFDSCLVHNFIEIVSSIGDVDDDGITDDNGVINRRFLRVSNDGGACGPPADERATRFVLSSANHTCHEAGFTVFDDEAEDTLDDLVAIFSNATCWSPLCDDDTPTYMPTSFTPTWSPTEAPTFDVPHRRRLNEIKTPEE
jgi:hypothetical protein